MIPIKYKESLNNSLSSGGTLFIGTVKSTDDPTRNGFMWVHIPELTGTDASAEALFMCKWSSPFAGATPPSSIDSKDSPEVSQTSYGMWMRPPDPENQVVVGFTVDRETKSKVGIVLGCFFQSQRNFMVPGIPAGKGIGGAVPVNEANLNSNIKDHNVEYEGTIKNVKVSADSRAMHELESVIFSQGLIDDFIRGQSTSGARREGASEVFGILTPGPKNPKDPRRRHPGHQFVMDDNNDNPHIRIRTGGGNQILLNDAENLIYISNKSGTGHIEIDGEGNIDIYGTGSYNVRTSGDMNLRADKDVNIEAGQNVNIKAANNYPHPADAQEVEKGVVDDEAMMFSTIPTSQGTLQNGSVNIEGVKDINLTSNEIQLDAVPRMFTPDAKTLPGSIKLYGSNLVHVSSAEVVIAAELSAQLSNPPTIPTMSIVSQQDIVMQSMKALHVSSATDKTYINAAKEVEIQTTPTIPKIPKLVKTKGKISTTDTTNTLLSFELAGILSGGYPKRAEQGKSSLTPLLAFDGKLKTIITRWVGIEPSPSRTNK